MEWIAVFDLVRHGLEFFFYLITGPLVTVFAFKKIIEKRDPNLQMVELQKKLLRLSQNNSDGFKKNMVPFVNELDSRLKKENNFLSGDNR